MSTGAYEEFSAVREAHTNTASAEYFAARPQVDDERNRACYEAGHKRGYDEGHADRQTRVDPNHGPDAFAYAMKKFSSRPAAAPIDMVTVEPGGDMHFTLIGAKYNLNFLTGKDRADMLAFGRDVWDAALATPAEPVSNQDRWDQIRKALNEGTSLVGIPLNIATNAVFYGLAATPAPIKPQATTLNEQLDALLEAAHVAHQVITVDLIPRTPFAMGSYSMCGDVRPGRKS